MKSPINLPRSLTGFQVKAQDMPRAAILTEMKPKGVVRSVIRELSEAAGAYIIVSSKGSVSDTALSARRRAMAEAVLRPGFENMWDFVFGCARRSVAQSPAGDRMGHGLPRARA